MKVHWMRYRSLIVDDESVTSIAASVVDVPIWIGWVGSTALLCEEQSWIVVIAPVGFAVHGEQPRACGVGSNGDIDCLGDGRISSSHGVRRDSLAERILCNICQSGDFESLSAAIMLTLRQPGVYF